MSERRKLPRGNSRQLVQYNDVIAEIGQSAILCVDRGVLRIIRVLLSSRAMWRTTYVLDYDSGDYFIPDSSEFQPIDNAISEFLKESADMTTCNELGDLIQTLTTTIASGMGGCCGEGSGGQSPDTPDSPFIDDQDTNYPDGFTNRAQYEAAKCNAAQWWINSTIADLNFTSTVNFTTATAGAIASALLVPGINVFVLIGVIGAITISYTLSEVIDNIVDWMVANNDDLLCAIYNSVDSANAQIAVQAEIDASSLSGVEAGLLSQWITSAGFNEAFEYGNLPNTGADCSSCGGCPDIFLNLGIWDGVDEFTSVLHPTIATQISQIQFNHNGTNYCGGTVTINSVTVLSGSPSEGLGAKAFRAFDQAANLIYAENTPPTNLSGVAHFIVRDSVAPLDTHVVRIDWSG